MKLVGNLNPDAFETMISPMSDRLVQPNQPREYSWTRHASLRSFRRVASKLNTPLILIFNIALISNSYSSIEITNLGSVWRLKGPATPRPSIEVSNTRQAGGTCAGRPTLDLVLKFRGDHSSWWDPSQTTFSGPCAVVARPLSEGVNEVRLSFLPPPTKNKTARLEYLVFSSPDRFVVDIWIGSDSSAKSSKQSHQKTTKTSQKASQPVSEIVSGLLINSFEQTGSWEKLLGDSALTVDFASPELNRFRIQGDLPKASPPDLAKIRELPLIVPRLNLESLEYFVDFEPTHLTIPEFVLSGTQREIQVAQDGLNYIKVLAEKKKWIQALGALDILEKSKSQKYIPQSNAYWFALKGNVYVKSGEEIKDKKLIIKGITEWSEALRRREIWGTDSHDPIEFMARETLSYLFQNQLFYAASSLLAWSKRFSWTAATEERFAFLRGESFYRLALMEDAANAFGEFLDARKDLPLNALADRRLLAASGFRLGDIEFKKKRYRGAISRYTEALVGNSPSRRFSFEGMWMSDDVKLFPYVLFNRAEAYSRLREDSRALRDYRAFLFVAPTHIDVGLAFYRIGDLLAEKSKEMAQNAWRECIFKSSKSFGGLLCDARMAAIDMMESPSPEKTWPRDIARIENILTNKNIIRQNRLKFENVDVWANILLADVFIQKARPVQAVLRLDTQKTNDIDEEYYAWWREYLITALAGRSLEWIENGKPRDVISDSEVRDRTLYLNSPRFEILWTVAKAYLSVGLYRNASDSLEKSRDIFKKINRPMPRPYDPSEDEWKEMRAEIDLNLEQNKEGRVSSKFLQSEINDLNLSRITALKIRQKWAVISKNPRLEADTWVRIEKINGLTWDEVESYFETLNQLKEESQKIDLLERRVGTWFKEKEKKLVARGPSAFLLFRLFEVRATSSQKSTALPVIDYLLSLSEAELGTNLTRPMILYNKAKLQRSMGKISDAKYSFDEVIKISQNSVWGELSKVALQEIGQNIEMPKR